MSLWEREKGSEGSVGKVDGAFGPEGYGRLMAAGCVEGATAFGPRVAVAAVAALKKGARLAPQVGTA